MKIFDRYGEKGKDPFVSRSIGSRFLSKPLPYRLEAFTEVKTFEIEVPDLYISILL